MKKICVFFAIFYIFLAGSVQAKTISIFVQDSGVSYSWHQVRQMESQVKEGINKFGKENFIPYKLVYSFKSEVGKRAYLRSLRLRIREIYIKKMQSLGEISPSAYDQEIQECVKEYEENIVTLIKEQGYEVSEFLKTEDIIRLYIGSDGERLYTNSSSDFSRFKFKKITNGQIIYFNPKGSVNNAWPIKYKVRIARDTKKITNIYNLE